MPAFDCRAAGSRDPIRDPALAIKAGDIDEMERSWSSPEASGAGKCV